MASDSMRRTSGSDLLLDLQTLNQSLSQPPASRRRNGSLTLQHPNIPLDLRRLSLPQWQDPQALQELKRGIRNWKPIRMLTHIGMRGISCLFLVEIIAIRNLAESMNGLRLTVGIRKWDSRDGAVRAMPSRVLQGCAQFDEAIFIPCNVYCSGGKASGKPIKLEPRPFQISVVAVDAAELVLGRAIVDLSQLIRESIDGNLAGARIRKWDAVLELAGKAEGGQLALRVGFQIMDDGGVGIYDSVVDTGKLKTKGLLGFSSARARRSMNSFSISTLDSRVHKMPVFERLEGEHFEVPEFEIVDRGIESWVDGEDSNDVEKASASGEVVKEVVDNRAEKQSRLMELDSIATEMRDLELMMNRSLIVTTNTTEKDGKELDASEETLTREFLKMLDAEANCKQLKAGIVFEKDENQEKQTLLPDLGNGLGPVIQTKDGGFMASMNQFSDEITRKETPKLALQLSKTFVLRDPRLSSGLEVFQRLAAVGLEELCSKLTLMAAMDELLGKTAEQIAFEGIASAIISGRNKEGARSSAAKSIGAVKRMISAMSEDRKRSSLNENWSVKEDSSVPLEGILAFSIQRIEGMAFEALKIQADMAEEEAAFDVSPLTGTDNPCQILDSAIAIDEEEKASEDNQRLTLLLIIQLRDPVRQYEAVGAPVIALIQAIRANDDEEDDGETRYRVISAHVGGLKERSGEKMNGWDGEKSKLTATQWLVANGMGKQLKKSRPPKSKLQQDLLWSLSSRIMENMWLRPGRNPDVKIAKR